MLFSAILVYTVYIALYLVDYGCRADQLECITETKFSKDFKPYATFFAGALPAIGAALFGIRAIGDFKSSARLSERMLVRILELRERHDDVLENPSRIRLRELNARTTMVMADDTLVWNMIFSERELTAGP